MKAILIETVLASGMILFWAAALPAALVLFPIAVLWEKVATLKSRGPLAPGDRIFRLHRVNAGLEERQKRIFVNGC